MRVSRTDTREVRGFVSIDLKHVSCEIEYKLFTDSNQLCMRMDSVRYKDKDPKVRRLHVHDCLKENPKRLLLSKTIEHLAGLGLALNDPPNVVWWTHN